MTGLNPVKDRILEVGLIVTDFDFNELATYEAVIFQEPSTLERLKQSDWYEYSNGKRVKKGSVYDMTQKSGLLARISTGKPESQVEQEIAKLIQDNFDQLAILSGNSIHQDRKFIRTWWPRVETLLHYRMLDVTSFKIWMQGKYGQEFRKPDQHRALEDIRGSIQELGYYLRKLPKYLEDSNAASEDEDKVASI